MTAATNVPVVCQRAAGRGGSPASQPSRGAGDTPTVTRAGRDVQVGDQVQRGPEVFLIVGFEARTLPFSRRAINHWAEGMWVHDDARLTVLNPSCSALRNNK